VLPAELQAATGRTYQVGRVAIRTLWFDRQLLEALDPARQPQPLLAELQCGGSGASSNGSGSAVQLRLTAYATPRQVVMLGAGMDTRAWRLQLPPGARVVLH
jgi:Leucine carboxyl methyltransferase